MQNLKIFFWGIEWTPKTSKFQGFFFFFRGIKLVSWKKTWKRNRDNFRDVFPLDFAWHWFWVSYSCLLLECFSLRNLQGVDPDVFYKVYRPLPLGPSLEDGEFTWPLWRWLVKWQTQRFGIKKRSRLESPGVVGDFLWKYCFFFHPLLRLNGFHPDGVNMKGARRLSLKDVASCPKNSPGTHSNGKNGVLWIRMHLLVKDCGFPLPCYSIHPCMLYAMFTYIYIPWKSTKCRINVGIGMPYRDGWGWFTGYLAVTCMENPWYFFAAIAGSWLASGSSRRGWQKSQQSQQKTSKSWSGRCFVYNGGLVIFCIYTFCFF